MIRFLSFDLLVWWLKTMNSNHNFGFFFWRNLPPAGWSCTLFYTDWCIFIVSILSNASSMSLKAVDFPYLSWIVVIISLLNYSSCQNFKFKMKIINFGSFFTLNSKSNFSGTKWLIFFFISFTFKKTQMSKNFFTSLKKDRILMGWHIEKLGEWIQANHKKGSRDRWKVKILSKI